MNTTSVSLLQRLKQPDQEQAWERFVLLYTPMIYRWARRISLSHVEASDLVQDVFATMVSRLPGFEYDRAGSFRAWLKTVTCNRARIRLRQLSRQQTGGNVGSNLMVEDQVEFLTRVEYQKMLAHQALLCAKSEFETNTWQACWMAVVDEVPTKQIAKQLGMTVNAVYLAKSRVLRHLRVVLSGLIE